MQGGALARRMRLIMVSACSYRAYMTEVNCTIIIDMFTLVRLRKLCESCERKQHGLKPSVCCAEQRLGKLFSTSGKCEK
jgi:hypothetical protein